jgi:hypothetical protein
MTTAKGRGFLSFNKEIDPRQVNRILDVASNGNPLNLSFTPIGDFTHSSFRVTEDIVVEMFKYQNPSGSNLNADGMIYQITHKNTKWLIFGDFDYIGVLKICLTLPQQTKNGVLKSWKNYQNYRLKD